MQKIKNNYFNIVYDKLYRDNKKKSNRKGTFGVPITILYSYIMYLHNIEVIDKIKSTINGKKLYDRIIIRIK